MTIAAADKPKPIPILEYGLLLLLATLWGASFSFIKITVASIPPLTAIACRTAMAVALLYAIMRWYGMRMPTDWDSWKSFAIVSAVNTVAPFILIAWGLLYVDAGLGVILNSTTPIFAFLITWALTRHEVITPRKLFGVGAGIAGIVLIVGTSALAGIGQQLLPQLAIVLASLSYATSAIYGRGFREMSPMAPAAGSLLVGTAVLTPLALVVEQPWTAQPTWSSIIALLVLGFACTALGNVLYFRLLGTLGSLGTTAQSYLRVPIGVLVGILLLGEQLTSTAAIGLVAVVAGVIAMTLPESRPLPIPWALIARGRRGLDLILDTSLRQVAGVWASVQPHVPPLALEYLLLLVIAVVWSGSYVWVKVGLETIPPLTLMAGRILTAAVFLFAVMRMRGMRLPQDETSWRNFATQGLITGVLPFSLVAWGQQWVDAGPAAILNSISPVFAFLITWKITRHEPATRLKLAGVVVGMLGIVVMIGPGALLGIGGQALPQLAIVLSSLCYALGAVNARHFRGSDPVVSATGSMLCGAIILVPVALLVDRPWTGSPSLDGLAAMVSLGVFSTGLGFVIYFRLMRTLGTLGVSAQSFLRAPIGVFLGAVLLGETVTLPMLGGLVLVVAGVTAMSLPARLAKPG